MWESKIKEREREKFCLLTGIFVYLFANWKHQLLELIIIIKKKRARSD
jgi:hypothetical protein